MGRTGVLRRLAAGVLFCSAFVTAACGDRKTADDDEEDGDGGPGGGNGATRPQRCVAFCEEILAAGCANYDHAGCVSSCVNVELLVADSGRCGGEFDAYLACTSGLSNVCDAVVRPDPDPCEGPLGDYADCFADFCVDNPSKPYCSGG